ncbi:MAG: hypothetical protein ACEY26_00620 [Candidatus Hodgkinia cicadicola]
MNVQSYFNVNDANQYDVTNVGQLKSINLTFELMGKQICKLFNGMSFDGKLTRKCATC